MIRIYRKVDFDEAKELIDATDCMIIDVREEFEYATGHAAGAVLFPLDEINTETAQKLIPNKNRTMLLYCKTGNRSAMAAEIFEQLGYKNIYDIGSLVDWQYGLEYGLD